MSDLSDRKSKRDDVIDGMRGFPSLGTKPVPDSSSGGASPTFSKMVHNQSCGWRAKKKERARRTLVDTLSARRPAAVSVNRGLTYSYSDMRAPFIAQSGPAVKRKDIIGLQFDPTDRHMTRTDPGNCDDGSDFQDPHARMYRSSSLHRSDTNLPQLIHDLNSSLKQPNRRNDESSDASSDDVIYNGEDVMQSLTLLWDKPRQTKEAGKHWLQYRPITPNLLERLDKLKVSSRTRTEQWVKQIPTGKRAYHSPLYRLGNVSKDDGVTSPAVYESWIYEETRRSAHGVRKPRQT